MLRRVIYTTNAIQSLNCQLRKVTKNRGQFPSSPPTVLVANTVIRQPWWSVPRRIRYVTPVSVRWNALRHGRS